MSCPIRAKISGDHVVFFSFLATYSRILTRFHVHYLKFTKECSIFV